MMTTATGTHAGGPLEGWTRTLQPDQARLVHRSFDGPASLTGPAGTGKTVVALHRAARAARRPGSRVLLTSGAATLPAVLGDRLRRLAPEHADRVDHVGVDAWARALLRERGVRLGRVDRDATDVAFGRAWSLQGRGGPLDRVAVLPRYWQDEIRHVVKGRGLTGFEDYATLERLGRRTLLRREEREAVWRLYETYQALLRDRGLADPADVLVLARDELRARPLARPYTAVVVDQAQDLTLVAVQLLHGLVGDRPDGLLLVGDPEQSLLPVGFTLAEAGIVVEDRRVGLGTHHHDDPTAAAGDETGTGPGSGSDVGPGTGSGCGRPTARVERVEAPSAPALEQALLAALLAAVRGGVRRADCAVLVRTDAEVARWVSLLLCAGVPVLGLTGYRGQGTDAVKVGTVHRARGLAFGHVVVVDADPRPRRRLGESTDAYDERAQVRRRQLHVALTRARDTAWCGYVVAPHTHR